MVSRRELGRGDLAAVLIIATICNAWAINATGFVVIVILCAVIAAQYQIRQRDRRGDSQ